MLLADPLSRATTDTPTQAMEDDVLIYDIKEMPRTSDRRLEELIEDTKKDDEMQELKAVVQQGWPDERKHTSPIVQPYWNIRNKISYLDGILFMGHRFVAPLRMRPYILGVCLLCSSPLVYASSMEPLDIHRAKELWRGSIEPCSCLYIRHSSKRTTGRLLLIYSYSNVEYARTMSPTSDNFTGYRQIRTNGFSYMLLHSQENVPSHQQGRFANDL